MLVAVLLVARNEPRRRDSLIEAIWSESRPRDAEHALDNLVSRVRKELGPSVIRSGQGGYALIVDPEALDAEQFEALAADGRAALAAGEPERARELLRAALALWRGEPFGELADASALADFVRRIGDVRTLAVEDRVDADLALGGHHELLPELVALIAEEPLRERRRAQLMLALHRSGRHAEALRVYRDYHAYLATELGLQPGRAVRELELAIAQHDPSLDLATAAPPRKVARARSRPHLVAGAVLGLIVAAITVGLLISDPADSGEAALQGHGVLFVASGDGDVRAVPTDGAVGALAALGGTLWGSSYSSGEAVRVDARRRSVTQTTRVGQGPSAVAAAGGDVWIADTPRNRVVRLDGESGQVVQPIPVGPSPVAVTAGFGSVWVASAGDQSLTRIDHRTGEITRTIELGAVPGALSAGAGGVWVVEPEARRVSRVNPRTHAVDVSVPVGSGPRSVAAGERAVWVANALDATVSRIDVGSGAVLATAPVGGVPTALAVDGDSVWVAVRDRRALLRLTGRSAREERRLELPGHPDALAPTGDGVAVAVSPPPDERRGGTLRVRTATPIESLDPGGCCVTPWTIMSLLYDGLTGFERSGVSAPPLVADLAVALPAPTADGTIHTFRVRPGLRYSDGTRVRASDFRRGFERVLRSGNEGIRTLDSIAIAAGCRPERRCDLAKTVVSDDVAGTVSIHLQRADPELLPKLAGHVAAPVPRSAPATVAAGALPGTGPYRVARFEPGRTIVLERNPHFREWSPSAQPAVRPDRVVFSLGGNPADAADDVLRGAADISLDPPAPATLARLRTEAPGQLHVHRALVTDWTWLNSKAPPFDDPRVRRAVNLAVDRRAAVEAFGGPGHAFATCQLLPPGISGYTPYCPYTRSPSKDGSWKGPDLRRARQLVRASGTAGMTVTLWTFPDEPYGPTLSRVVLRALRQLGYRTRLRIYDDPDQLPRRDAGQAYAGSEDAERSSAAQMLTPLLRCRAFRPGRPGDTPYPGALCDDELLRLIERALEQEPGNPASARLSWAAADRLLVDHAVIVPLVNETLTVATGPRVGNYAWNQTIGPILGQMWLR